MTGECVKEEDRRNAATLRSIFRMVPGLCNTAQLKHMNLFQWYLAEILIGKICPPVPGKYRE